LSLHLAVAAADPRPGIPFSAYSWQTLGNAISFITGLIAALLYGNIGVKVFYSSVLRDVFRFPPLDKKTGKWIWVAISKDPRPFPLPLAFAVARDSEQCTMQC
jgi:hypothetical protein